MNDLLCDLGIQNRSDYRRWALKNHPDKNGNVEQFKRVTQAVTDLLPTNEKTIECEEKPNSPKKVPVSKASSPKKAVCVRNMENWTKIMRHHRFDKSGFKPAQMRDEMATMSPKMNELINTIRKLDAADLASGLGLHKHFIFSDIKAGGYGAKIIASSLAAHGFHSCFDRSGKMIVPKPHKAKETFGILSSTSVFSKTFTKEMVKTVLKAYNQRPDNVYGERMRFVVLDSGFKEGVDLFDVKYVHIFERQRNEADLIQAIGRATRSCGQKGLTFVPNEGWKLHVYMYHSVEAAQVPVFERYLAFSGVDLNKVEFAKNLERMAIFAAVDHDLNQEIHKHGNETSETSKSPLALEGGDDPSFGCEGGKCGKRTTKSVPFTLQLMEKVYLTTVSDKLPKNFRKLLVKEKRAFFCDLLKSNKSYCEKVNKHYKKEFTPQKRDAPSEEVQDLMDLREDMQQTASVRDVVVRSKTPTSTSEDPSKMSFEKHRAYVNRAFAKYKYPRLQVRNGCDDPVTSDDRVIKFTESQDFISHYFTPKSHMKGLLVWHSVGTGKTCTAISLKSLTFEKENYWVIWVTRSTLREDIWKNMYDKICDHRMRALAKEGVDTATLKKNMYKRFLPPMSYRQFANLIEGKNDLSRKLLSENSKENILDNCLIIVDEAHKLYSKDLVGQEKPDMEVISRAIDRSSCKLVLMTGTPVADDPMEFFQLMNLILPPKDKFPTDFRTFHKTFLRDNEFTSGGKKVFLDRTKGLISYLNRRFDPRQFAQPVFYEVPVPISVPDDAVMEKCKADLLKTGKDCKSGVPLEEAERTIKAAENDMEAATKERAFANERLKSDKKNPDLKARADSAKRAVQELMSKLRTSKAEQKKLVKQHAKCEREIVKETKKCLKAHDERSQFYQKPRLDSC